MATFTDLVDGVSYVAGYWAGQQFQLAPLSGSSNALPAASYGSPVSVAGANADGTAKTLARSDHVHTIAAGTVTNAMVSGAAAIAYSKLNLANSLLLTDLASGVAATSWTPAFSGSGTAGTPTYNANGQVGRYCRIGPLVIAEFYISLATIGGMTGNLQISLPVAAISTTNLLGSSGCIVNVINLAAGYSYFCVEVIPGTSTMLLVQSGNNIGPSTVNAATDVRANSDVRGVIAYFAA